MTSVHSSKDNDSQQLDASDVSRLLIEHRARLMAYLVSCVRNYVDAEDLFQEVSIAAINSAGALGSANEFLPWAREIARRRVLAQFRKSKRLTPVDPELAKRLAETAAMLDQSSEVPARMEALHACLESLPQESRKLLPQNEMRLMRQADCADKRRRRAIWDSRSDSGSRIEV